LELEEVLKDLVISIQIEVDQLQRQLQDIQEKKMEWESLDDGEVLEYNSEHGQESQESSEEEAPRYGLSEDALRNSPSYTTASQGLNKGKHSEKTHHKEKLYVKDYRFNSAYPEHGVMH